jgi:lysophospholipase L1-like esterase
VVFTMKPITAFIKNKKRLDQAIADGNKLAGWTEESQQLNNKINSALSGLAEKAAKTEVNSLAINKAEKTYVDTKFSLIGSATPKGAYATLAALQSAFPTGNTNIYVVTADGKWYYWNGTAWTAGGTYQSTGIADGGVKPENIEDNLVNQLFDRYDNLLDSRRIHKDGALIDSATTVLSKLTYNGAAETFTKSSTSNRFELIRDGVNLSAYAGKKMLVVIPFEVVSSPQNIGLRVIAPFTGGNRGFSLPVGKSVVMFTATAASDVFFYNLRTDDVDYTGMEIVFKTPGMMCFNVDGLTDDLINKIKSLINRDWVKYVPIKKAEANSGLENRVVTLESDNTNNKSRLSSVEVQLSTFDGTNPLSGKKLVAIGDSIMRGGGNNNVGFVDLIGTKFGMNVNNISISGSTMATGVSGRNSISTMLSGNILANPDFIVINGGINDYFMQVPLGDVTAIQGDLSSGSETSFSNFNTTTFCGALESLFKYLYTNYPTAKVIFVITHKSVNHYYNNNDGDIYDYSHVREKTILACEKWGIEYVDLFTKSRLITSVPLFNNRQYTNNNDGVHPNQLGYELFYVPPVVAKMKAMI